MSETKMKTINLDEIIDANFTGIFDRNQRVIMKSLMKEAIRQALEIAAEDVKYTIRPYVDDHGFDQEEWRVDKKSILKVIERVK